MPDLGETPSRFKEVLLDLIQVEKGNTNVTSFILSTLSTSTTILTPVEAIDWSLFPDTPYWNVAWGHAAASVAAGGMKMILYDFTNGTTLYTFSSNTSAATNTDFSTVLATSVTFAKPRGLAKVGMVAQNTDTTGRQFMIMESTICIT